MNNELTATILWLWHMCTDILHVHECYHHNDYSADIVTALLTVIALCMLWDVKTCGLFPYSRINTCSVSTLSLSFWTRSRSMQTLTDTHINTHHSTEERMLLIFLNHIILKSWHIFNFILLFLFLHVACYLLFCLFVCACVCTNLWVLCLILSNIQS